MSSEAVYVHSACMSRPLQSPQALSVIRTSYEADHSLQRQAPRPPTFLGRRLPRTRSLSSPTRSTLNPSKLLPFLLKLRPTSRFLSRGGERLQRKRLYGQSQLPERSPSTRHPFSHPQTSNHQQRNANQSTSPRSKRALRAKRKHVRAVHAAWLN